MKICFLAHGDIHTERWCKHFSAKGFDVHLISFNNVKMEGVTVHYVSAGGISMSGGNWKVILTLPFVKQLLKQIRPDILHAHYATSYGLVGALSGYRPYIVTALGSDVLVSPNQSLIYKLLVKYVLRKADWVTAMAEHMKNTMINLGVSENKITTIMFGIDPLVFNRKNRHLPDNKFVITSTRMLEPIYNLPLLLRALSMIKDNIPNLEVRIIGSGSQKKMLSQMVIDLGLMEKVKFFGKIPQVQIAENLNQTHLFITVSLSDGNNVSLNEAMACGVVSIATNIPANIQWIKDGINGYFVPIDNAEFLAGKILKVYQDYNNIQQTAIEYNDKIIAEKALWASNMAIVENKYMQLVGK